METNIKITVPEGYELKWNADHTEVEVVKKELTYEEISRKLFLNKKYYYSEMNGDIADAYGSEDSMTVSPLSELNNATSKTQIKKMLAFNKLMNIAVYLNEGWSPDLKNIEEEKFYIFYSLQDEKCHVTSNRLYNEGHAYFKTRELAEQAIKIMGDDLDLIFKN